MKFRGILSLVLLLLVGGLVACSDPVSPRFPEPEEDEQPDPDDDEQTGFHVRFLDTPTHLT